MSEVPPILAAPRQVLEGFHRAMLHKSADELAGLFAVDAVYEFPLLNPSRPERYRSREDLHAGFRAAWERVPVRIDEFRNVVVHETTDPEVIVSEQEAVATVLTNGRTFALPFLLVIRVRDGRIVHLRDYSDTLRAAQALGRLPALLEALGGTLADSS
jgi:ketosteroid isomerase-like protein